MATLDDIAKKANVSKSAVSLVLNNKDGVGEEKRRKILKIAQDMGYIPRSLIKADKLYRTPNVIRFLAYIKSDIVSTNYQTAPFFVELLHDLQNQSRKKGYSLIISSLELDELEKGISDLESDHPSDGIILLGTNLTGNEVKKVADHHSKLVVLDSKFELLNVNTIVMNNELGAYQAATYLIELGHRDIGYIQSKTRVKNFDERKKTFIKTLAENDLGIKKSNYYHISSEINQAREQFVELFKNKSKEEIPTALFCEDDYLAIGVIRALQELQIKVPDDISVIGFDDIAQSSLISPPLTTIHVDKDRMAKMAVDRLVEVIKTDDDRGLEVTINTNLVERDSCRPI